MSILEIVLMVLIGGGVITYCTIIMVKALKRKKNKKVETEEAEEVVEK